MKKIIILLIALTPLLTTGQSAMDGIFKKYSGNDGFTTVNIGPEMFQLLANSNIQLEGDGSEEFTEAQKAMTKLSSLRILTCEGASSDLCLRFKKDVTSSVPDNYLEMMTVKEGDSDVKFLARQENDGTISELLMLVIDTQDVVLMSFTGEIDMNTITKIGSAMQLNGMDTLENVEEEE
ncbi:MAG: DUF4252 domain-containing protein [Bacteroidia bacterium]|jgi:hypothetical protein|nr:DUF4252 domain-containing protein [Bacteroidales bacterium]NCD40985.1 DUF4252 domain-containing protein [Bacteroidia bacterium]MDD2322242.1 DUF4252 domain-containing protein [Bacteroidales bacterium]MDD3011122.1 DUF4252 domain-containing protein [Bacteroidales bacterium]MDD3960279.1 DUF4252 domain-containing protein [Bacteroidales bacterium]